METCIRFLRLILVEQIKNFMNRQKNLNPKQKIRKKRLLVNFRLQARPKIEKQVTFYSMVKTSSLVKCSLRSYRLSERRILRKILLLKHPKTESQLFGYWEHSIVITIIQINGLIISHFLCSFSFLYRGKRKAFIQL